MTHRKSRLSQIQSPIHEKETMRKLMKNNVKLILAGLSIAVLAACGPKKPTITQQTIADARANGSLEQLYQKIQTDLKEAGSSEKKELIPLARQIAEQIAVDKQQAIYQSVEDSRVAFNVAPMATLKKLKEKSEEIKPWSETRYNETQQKLTALNAESQDALNRQMMIVNKIAISDKVQRVNAMAIAAQIGGPESVAYSNYKREKDQLVVSWMVEADTAISKRKYGIAATSLRMVLGIDPENTEAQEKLAQSEQLGFENTFRKALEDSKPDLALSELKRISQSNMFDSVKGNLTTSINLLHDYFVNNGLQSASQGALKGAYSSFAKAREVKAIMQQEPQHEAEHGFLQKLINFANSLGNNGRYGEQIAYLEIVNRFNPNHPALVESLASARKSIVEFASTSLNVQDFSQTGTHHSAGKSVAKNVYSWVYQNMPGDMNLLSLEQMLAANQTIPGRLLRIEGDILQAGVDTETDRGEKTMRVVTKTTKTPNPAYAVWKKDPDGKPKPEEFLLSEQFEDVSVSVSYLRKTGIISANFRLIDQKTGQVLLNEDVREKKLYEGEGNEGISLGEFNLPYKRAELPSEIEIMEELSVLVAKKIGAKLQALYKNSDDNYEAAGDKAMADGQYAAAKSFYGYAVAIRAQKGADIGSLQEKLIDVVINN